MVQGLINWFKDVIGAATTRLKRLSWFKNVVVGAVNARLKTLRWFKGVLIKWLKDVLVGDCQALAVNVGLSAMTDTGCLRLQ